MVLVDGLDLFCKSQSISMAKSCGGVGGVC